MKIKQSETITIKRSQITLNPYNPKNHTEENIKRQQRNFRKVGFLGGITWNRQSGNLLDGHRRIFAMDVMFHYDGTPETDYDVKVEAVDLDDKAEKEQMTYMAVGNTKADINLVKIYAEGLDLSDVGFADWELDFLKDIETPMIDTFDEEYKRVDEEIENEQPLVKCAGGNERQYTPEDYAERRQHMMDIKSGVAEVSSQTGASGSAFFTVSFSTYGAKVSCLETLGFDASATFIKGEELMERLDL